MTCDLSIAQETRFELRFPSLSSEGCWIAFPCDAAGRVNLDHLTEVARCNYLFARAMRGREYAAPSVREV